MATSLRLAVIPMTSTDLVEVNLREALFQISNTKEFKPDLICFPENSLFFNFQKQLDPQQALTLDHPAWELEPSPIFSTGLQAESLIRFDQNGYKDGLYATQTNVKRRD